MKKELSLKSNASFSYIRRKGKRYNSPYLSLICVPAGSLKLGVAVSKKIGHAVERNLIKRRIKEIFVSEKNKLKKYNFVVSAKDKIVDVSFSELRDDFVGLLKTADVYKNNEIFN